jgi:hypothetical protein
MSRRAGIAQLLYRPAAVSTGGVSVPETKKFLSTPQRSNRLWGPSILLSNAYLGLFSLKVKQPGCEAENSPLPSAEVKNGRGIPPLPHIFVTVRELIDVYSENPTKCIIFLD